MKYELPPNVQLVYDLYENKETLDICFNEAFVYLEQKFGDDAQLYFNEWHSDPTALSSLIQFADDCVKLHAPESKIIETIRSMIALMDETYGKK